MTTRIHIILPNRIGDSILALPALLCLHQLFRKYPDNSAEITVFSHFRLVGLFRALELEPFRFRHFDASCKLLSWIRPPAKAFFLSTTSKNIGYRSKTSYGLPLSNKKLVRYTNTLPCLDGSRLEDALPGDLLNFLRTEYSLPAYSLRHFGICLELGFSVEQILNEFKFGGTNLLRDDRYVDKAPLSASDYIVFCMEAAYNRRHASKRRWHADGFFDLAAKLHADHGIESVFVGLQNQPHLPERDYMKDLRTKLSLEQIVDVLTNSRGFIGNDSGLLHLANLLRKKTMGTYPGDAGKDYWPLYPQFNKVFTTAQQPAEFYPFLGHLVSKEDWPG
jgi:Glycosyltransferase family 9 (heptosyltransferase)